MKISLICAPPEGYHGWGRYTLELARQLVARGHALQIITSTDAPDSPPPDLASAEYIRILPSVMQPLRLNSARIWLAAPQVQRLTASADVIHVTAEPYALAAFSALRPVIVTAHGTYVPRLVGKALWGALYARMFRRVTLICVSDFTAGQVRAALPLVQTTVIPNGVDVDEVRRTVPPVAKSGPTVITIGQIKERKGSHILIEAMREVCVKVPAARLVLIGDDSDSAFVDALRAKVTEYGIAGAVRFAGRVSDDVKIGWLQAADVFALPALNAAGKFEGFGLVYLEASATGLPVIGTRGNGAEQAIRDGETGFLIAQNDPAALAARVIELLTNPALRQRMGSAGWEYSEAHRWSLVAERVIALYRSLI